MKKLLLVFLVVGLFISCNNKGGNPFAKKSDNDKTEKEESDDKSDGNKKKGGLFGKIDDKNGRDDSRNSWTKSYRDKVMEACADEMNRDPKTELICACAVDKMERKYPDEKEADVALEKEGRKILEQCKASAAENDEYTEGQYTGREKEINNPVDEGNHGKSWTPLQRQQYIQGCATTAKRNNQAYTDQQINSYCDCMTKKVEKKYSFQDAARMTAADFQTQEWQSAAADCMPRY